MSKPTVELFAMETHVECLVWDPFPTIDKRRFDGCTRESIVASCVETYSGYKIAGALISVTIYDISVVKVDGVKYRSEPLNKQTWAKTL